VKKGTRKGGGKIISFQEVHTHIDRRRSVYPPQPTLRGPALKKIHKKPHLNTRKIRREGEKLGSIGRLGWKGHDQTGGLNRGRGEAGLLKEVIRKGSTPEEFRLFLSDFVAAAIMPVSIRQREKKAGWEARRKAIKAR